MSSLCTANNRNVAPRPYRRLLERRLKTEDESKYGRSTTLWKPWPARRFGRKRLTAVGFRTLLRPRFSCYTPAVTQAHEMGRPGRRRQLGGLRVPHPAPPEIHGPRAKMRDRPPPDLLRRAGDDDAGDDCGDGPQGQVRRRDGERRQWRAHPSRVDSAGVGYRGRHPPRRAEPARGDPGRRQLRRADGVVGSRTKTGLSMQTNETVGLVGSARLVHVDDTDQAAAIAVARAARVAGVPVTSDIDRLTDLTEELVAAVSLPMFAEHVPAALTGESDPERALRKIRRTTRNAYTLAASLVFWCTIKLTVGLRVSKDEEEQGLDIGEHGQVAYTGFTSAGVRSLTSCIIARRAGRLAATMTRYQDPGSCSICVRRTGDV